MNSKHTRQFSNDKNKIATLNRKRIIALWALIAIIVLTLGYYSSAMATTLSAGDILVADRGADGGWSVADGSILQIDPITGTTNVISSGDLLYNPHSMIFDTDGSLLVTDGRRILGIDPFTGAQMIISDYAGFSNPHGLAIGQSGELLVVDEQNKTIYKVDRTTGSATIFASGLQLPEDIEVDANGDLLVTDLGFPSSGTFDRVVLLDGVTGNLKSVITSDDLLTSPVGIALEAGGGILLTNYDLVEGSIITVDPMTGAQTILSQGDFLLRPMDIAIEATGSLLVADREVNALIRIDRTTGDQTFFASGNMTTPYDVLVVETTPVPEPIIVSVDIKPGSCRNPLNIKSKGVLPVAVLGSADFDIIEIDLASIRLNDIAPIRSSIEDVTRPDECYDSVPDGFDDLNLKFDTQEIVSSLGPVDDGEEITLILTGTLVDGTEIEGEDVIVILKKGKKSDDGGDPGGGV